MARKTPTVLGDMLALPEADRDQAIAIGSPEWFAWLDQATSFYYVSPAGTFTACRERFQRGGWYWRAHRRRSGTVRRAYLGKADALTPERLAAAAAALASSAPGASGVGGAPAGESGEAERTPAEGSLSAAESVPPPRRLGEDPGERLLSTKLLFPALRPNLVSRPRLHERLDDILGHRLLLVSAPAGFGKTTMLALWSQRATCPVAWVSLDAGDDDPARFWAYFITALQRFCPTVAAPVFDLLRSPEALTGQAWLGALINALADLSANVVVVLDDYHVVESPAVHRAVDYLLDHLPPRLHLIIATRVDPPLALSRLRGKGQMIELRASDLSFTRAEAAAFLNQTMAASVSDAEVAVLSDRTEGWAVGLQVAALSLRGVARKDAFIEGFAGEHRHIMDYLLDEVFSREATDVQSFLLLTSILDRLSAPLCEAVTGRPGAQEMLEALERAGLFTLPLDAARRWYRYHRLFDEFLRARLRQTQPDKVPELHRRACAWFAAQGLVDDAIGHALAGEDFSFASTLIEQRSVALRKQGQIGTILRWLGALPEQTIRERPGLGLLHAWLLVSISELDGAEIRLAQAEAAFRAGPGASPKPVASTGESADHERFEDEALALRAQIAGYRGDWRLAIALGRQALDRATGVDKALAARIRINLGSAYWWGGDIAKAAEVFAHATAAVRGTSEIPGAVSSLCSLASAQRARGHLRDAARTYGQALDIVTENEYASHLLASWPNAGLGRLRYEWNDLAGARRCAEECLRLTRGSGVALLVLSGYALLERVHQAEGDVEAALETNQQAQRMALLHDNPRELPLLRAYQARLWLAQGNLEAAVRWTRESGLSPADRPSYEHESEYIALAQILIAQGQADAVQPLLASLLRAAEAADRLGSAIKILVLQALGWQTRGEPLAAQAALGHALVLAEAEGYVRSFVDRGPAVAPLLTAFFETPRPAPSAGVPQPLPAYVRSLLTAFERTGAHETERAGQALPATTKGQTLSEREREVLKLISAGWSGPEIARQLFVSLNTVKTHRLRIYAILEVHTAREAAAKARDLGLL